MKQQATKCELDGLEVTIYRNAEGVLEVRLDSAELEDTDTIDIDGGPMINVWVNEALVYCQDGSHEDFNELREDSSEIPGVEEEEEL